MNDASLSFVSQSNLVVEEDFSRGDAAAQRNTLRLSLRRCDAA